MWTYGFAICLNLLPTHVCHVRDGHWITPSHAYPTEQAAYEAMVDHQQRIRSIPGWAGVGAFSAYLISGSASETDHPVTDFREDFVQWRKEFSGESPSFARIE